jgi:hypothetical protein
MADRTYHLQTGRVVLAGATGDALQWVRIDLCPPKNQYSSSAAMHTRLSR